MRILSLAILPIFILMLESVGSVSKFRGDFSYKGRRFDDYGTYLEFVTNEEERGLFPNIFNLATNSLIQVNATCGQDESEVYCKLVEHVFMRRPQCDFCDDSNLLRRHPIEYAIDGSNKWWQSPSLATGLHNEWVTITLDLRQQYQVAYVIVKSAIAARPGTWVLERSLDGLTFSPWQYYVAYDSDCMRFFGVPATVGVPRFDTDDQVICTSHYSQLYPLENGEIHTSLVNDRPGIKAPSEELQNFTRARFIRLHFQKLRTLNADKMFTSYKKHGKANIDKSVMRRYFYAIKDISIGGQCICYGHAETCPSDPITGQLRCDCRHNTCGESCNICCPLFNQLIWKSGSNTEPNICQACQCFNHASKCVYDEEIELLGMSVTPEGIFEGGGKCVDCQHNTEGVNCEKCLPHFYRPSGISHYREDACRACDCDLVGSIDGNCISDETTSSNDLKSGDCVCKPGFGGRRCDHCAVGFRNHPVCEPCPCNQAGSINFDDCEQETCICKANVEGIFCDRCRAGTINLNANNPEGCQSCFCFGITNECQEYRWGKTEIRDMINWKLTDQSGQRIFEPKDQNGKLLMFNDKDVQDSHLVTYWRAPDTFNENRLNSYGGLLQYFVYFVPHRDGPEVRLADVVIQGNGVKVEHHARRTFFPRENISVQVRLHESDRWLDSTTGRPVQKRQFMNVLANVQSLMIRTRYRQQQMQASIYGLTLESATNEQVSADSDAMISVEKCSCPVDFEGNSCESCSFGFRRVNDQLYAGSCRECLCQGHSESCDPFTGHCSNCRHNTTGARCEHCLLGHYGNPSLGAELGVCRRCACPGVDEHDSFSQSCSLAELVVGGPMVTEDDYVCTACADGYTGNKCQICADGYFGDPLSINGSCSPCSCNDNVDPMAIGNCHPLTGMCLKCIRGTAGDHCQRCKEDHYGSATDQCLSCDCHLRGAVTSKCDTVTGLCECAEFYQGRLCDRCLPGHGDVDNGCPKCACNSIGSLSKQCNDRSGQCSCKTGVFGKYCDSCLAGYFNFTTMGCKYCNCDLAGSVDDGSCDDKTGQCFCRDHVQGVACDQCELGFFNITSGMGCQACQCDSLGAEHDHCDVHSGQCVCRPGVSGLRCRRCSPNYYGLDEDGCKECGTCPAPGQVCDPTTGNCVCPPNTVGSVCDRCADNSWNYNPLSGCLPCDCDSEGASSGACHLLTGHCHCRNEYIGQRCDMCNHGHFNFPTCEPCQCNVVGTEEQHCNLVQDCNCDENGQCPCKSNMEGLKCGQCQAKSFSADLSNPSGCTSCFCFGRTDFCVQSSLVWQQKYAPDRRVLFEKPWQYYRELRGLRVLKDQPAVLNSYLTDDTPLYWSLPSDFLGDRISSYNGFLRFKLNNHDWDRHQFRRYPMVILIGNDRLELEYRSNEMNNDGKYKVRFREDQWRSRFSPEIALTRQQLMVALQRVQGIFIRATYRRPEQGDSTSISVISLDVAVWDNTTDAVNSTAIGVENCGDCPQGYSGMSCQNPAEGYCRKRIADYLNSPGDLHLIGFSQPCACHGHSTTCDVETCRCTNCVHNTFGDFCQYCLPGYYGEARGDHPDVCRMCACPTEENSFSNTCTISVDADRGYVCDACSPGYSGSYCESCSTGYFGDPEGVNGFCQRCDCHPDGSLESECHPVSGQCRCRTGVTGRDCSRCQERHAFINNECTSCDQGCTLELMLTLDEMERLLEGQNFTGLVPIPWKRLFRVENDTDIMASLLGSVHMGKIGSEQLLGHLNARDEHSTGAKSVADQANFLLARLDKSAEIAGQLINQTEDVSDLTNQIYGTAWDVIHQLEQFAQFGGSKRPIEADIWLTESNEYLEAMKKRNSYIDKRFNRATVELQKTAQLLKRIMARKLNDTDLKRMTKQLDSVNEYIEAYRDTVWDETRADTISANRISGVSEKRRRRLEQVLGEIEESMAESIDRLTEGENSIEGAKKDLLIGMFDNYREMNETLFDGVQLAIQQCTGRSDNYGQLLSGYRRDFVESSQIHADQLAFDAARLRNSFIDTKTAAETPLAASNAYQDIVLGLKNATKAAKEAKKAADKAHELASSKRDRSMLDTALKSMNVSLELLESAGRLQLADLGNKRRQYTGRLDRIDEMLISWEKMREEIKDQYQTFDDQHDRMLGVIDEARKAEESTRITQQEVDRMKQDIDTMDERVDKLDKLAGKSIREVTDEVRQAGNQVANARWKLDSVKEQVVRNDALMGQVGSDLASLKDKIEEAREKASRIRISVKSTNEGLCLRWYPSPAQPTPSNTISIKYRPLQTVPDSLIILTKTKSRRTQPSEYMALELRERLLIFHWDVGGGSRMITNKRRIDYIVPAERNTWYHIDVKRNGDSALLTVAKKRTENGDESVNEGEPQAVEHAFSGSDQVIFNTRPGETRLSFGSDEDLAPIHIFSRHFRGTVGSLHVDGQKLPLWDFSDSNDACLGAVSPQETSSIGHLFRDGYAQVRMSFPERPDNSIITVFFSAHSPDGLLYFRGSRENGDFISLELRNGSVVFKFNLGGQSFLTIRSRQKAYNDGRTHTIKAIRTGQEGALQVDSESDRNAARAPGKNSGLNVVGEEHFVGGVPSSFDTSKWSKFDIRWRGFFGCIESIKPSQFSELDLNHPARAQRLEPGCLSLGGRLYTTDRVVGFKEFGYLVLSGVGMDDNSSFAFNFRTYRSNATLVFQSSRLATYRRRERETAYDKGYMAFYLYKGRLVAHLGTNPGQRSTVATLRTETRLDDGQIHSVFVQRDGHTVNLMVDDQLIGSDTLSDSATIGSNRAQMFIGGFPSGTRPISEELPSSKHPLIGCVSDLFLNYQRLPLIPELHNATIGVCPLNSDHREMPQIRAQSEELLQDSERKSDLFSVNMMVTPTVGLNNAIGMDADIYAIDYNYSDVVPITATTTTAATTATTATTITTTTTEYIPFSSTHKMITSFPATTTDIPTPALCIEPQRRPSDGLGAAQFGISESSHSRLIYRSPYPSYENLELSFSFRTTEPNGMLWIWANYKQYSRFFNMSLTNGHLLLTIKGHRQPGLLMFNRTRLDDDRWHSVKLNKIDKEIRLMVDEFSMSMKRVANPKVVRKRMFVGGILSRHRKMLKNHDDGWDFPGFRGCIRDFAVNSETQDLLNELYSRDVIPCVSSSSASYIHPGGYLTFDSLSYPGGVVQLGVQFRSGQSNGWILGLLTTKSARKTRMELRLLNGKMILLIMLNNRLLYSYKNPDSDFSTCDGRWHHVSITIDDAKNQFVFILDQQRHVIDFRGVIDGQQLGQLAKLPLHVAGLPASVMEELGVSTLNGCFRSLQIGGLDVSFKSAKRINKVMLHRCAYSEN